LFELVDREDDGVPQGCFTYPYKNKVTFNTNRLMVTRVTTGNNVKKVARSTSVENHAIPVCKG
jgi:hypothetical protein